MAEGLFRAMVQGREDFIVQSAGVHASEGQRASQHTVTALKEVGVDLSPVRSQPLTNSLISDATPIFVIGKLQIGNKLTIAMPIAMAAAMY